MGQCIIWRDNQHFSKRFPCLLHTSLLNERKDKDAVGGRERSIALKGVACPAFGLLGFSFHQSGSSHPDGCIERIWIKGGGGSPAGSSRLPRPLAPHTASPNHNVTKIQTSSGRSQALGQRRPKRSHSPLRYRPQSARQMLGRWDRRARQPAPPSQVCEKRRNLRGHPSAVERDPHGKWRRVLWPVRRLGRGQRQLSTIQLRCVWWSDLWSRIRPMHGDRDRKRRDWLSAYALREQSQPKEGLVQWRRRCFQLCDLGTQYIR